MKILKKGRNTKIPQNKRLKCNLCGCKMRADFEDVHPGQTVLDVPAFYVCCPQCGKSIFYSYR